MPHRVRPLGESAAQNYGRPGSANPYRIGRSVGTTASLPPDAAPIIPPYWARAESRLTERKCRFCADRRPRLLIGPEPYCSAPSISIESCSKGTFVTG